MDVYTIEEDYSLDVSISDLTGNSYDRTSANHLLEHVLYGQNAVKELLSVVKPDGFLQFAFPTPHSQLRIQVFGVVTASHMAITGPWFGYCCQIFYFAAAYCSVQVIGWDTVFTDRWEVVFAPRSRA